MKIPADDFMTLHYGRFFEDTIDGYFPLAISLNQMMVRNGFSSAFVSLIQAPIMNIPGLPDEAPVPLNIASGEAGLIEDVVLWVNRSQKEPKLRGCGTWRWFSLERESPVLNPMTRLAEPAFVMGIGLTDVSGPRTADQLSRIAEVNVARNQQDQVLQAMDRVGWKRAHLWGPTPTAEGIIQSKHTQEHCFGLEISSDTMPEYLDGVYLLGETALKSKLDA